MRSDSIDREGLWVYGAVAGSFLSLKHSLGSGETLEAQQVKRSSLAAEVETWKVTKGPRFTGVSC